MLINTPLKPLLFNYPPNYGNVSNILKQIFLKVNNPTQVPHSGINISQLKACFPLFNLGEQDDCFSFYNSLMEKLMEEEMFRCQTVRQNTNIFKLFFLGNR